MINLTEIPRLKLSNYIPLDKISSCDDWKYEDRIWHCDAYGFTQFCHDLKSGDLGALSIDLNDFSHKSADSIFNSINIPLTASMDIEEITEILGEATEVHQFTPDRKTFEFWNYNNQNINIGITALESGEFIYFTLLCNA